MIEVEAGALRRAGRRRGSRWALAGLTLAGLFALAGALVLARAVMLRSAVLPGVSVAGVDVGGLDRSETRRRLDAILGANLHRPVTVSLGATTFTTTPDTVYRLDVAATEQAAFDAGRGSILSRLGAVVAPFAVKHDVEPVLRIRPNGRETLAAELNDATRKPVSARLAMEGLEPVVTRARWGTEVDEPAFAEALRRTALGGGGDVKAIITAAAPAITTAEARSAAGQAATVVSAPVGIRLKARRVGQLSPQALAGLIRFQPAHGTYRVVLARDALERAVAPMIASVTREPVDATFEVGGTRVRVVRSRGGTRLASIRAARTILAAALTTGAGPRAAAIGVTKLEADLTTREAKALGIKRQISTFTTDMGLSSSNRISNVLLLGKYLDGTILKPGDTFSFNGVIGPRTPERGFLEGQMILGGVLVPSIGGGVCQTATTIFNAAFEAGLPVSERHNHSFYISHYPMGRDATVSWGGPDLVFKNDLDHAILIKASGTSATFTVSFYGTPQGRKIVASTSDPTNYTAPTLHYAVDPSAPRGSVRTTAAGGSGFDVNVHRKVYENGKVIREDDFFTRYTPENPTAIYGPGKTPPGPYFTLPPT